MIAAKRLEFLIGRRCRWTPHRSDEVGVDSQIVDAVLTPAQKMLVLVAPRAGHGGAWVLGSEVWCDGRRLG